MVWRKNINPKLFRKHVFWIFELTKQRRETNKYCFLAAVRIYVDKINENPKYNLRNKGHKTKNWIWASYESEKTKGEQKLILLIDINRTTK